MNNRLFEIEYQCPQCGAPAIIEETDRMFQCRFCRVKSYLLSDDYFRYMLPAKETAPDELYYFPYWRFKGMLFACTGEGIRHKIIDISRQATDSHPFPFSIGVRGQTMRLRFLSARNRGRFVPAELL